MRGRWAAGIVPRNFCWIIKDHFAVSERPGGYAPNHRKVRRQEELLWLRAQGFTRVVSLLGSTHNLHAYDELGLEWSRFPLPAGAETREILAELYPWMLRWLRGGERILLHQEELGDRVMGVAAGYLLWSELLPDGPRAITAMEQLLRRQMGTVGRMIVANVEEIPPFDSFSSLAGGAPFEAAVAADLEAEAAAEANPTPVSSEVAAPGPSEVKAAPGEPADAKAAPGQVAGVKAPSAKVAEAGAVSSADADGSAEAREAVAAAQQMPPAGRTTTRDHEKDHTQAPPTRSR
jgi:hypothetical protein